jgi:Icc-related predicted phosphoesterase
LEVVEEINPGLHVFGHIHEGAGIKHSPHTAYLNASSCDAYFQPVNPPLVYDYSP